jgi:hypothetical protein
LGLATLLEIDVFCTTQRRKLQPFVASLLISLMVLKQRDLIDIGIEGTETYFA